MTKIDEFARECGFNYAKFLKKKDGKDIYVARSNDNTPITTGLPIFIVVEG